MTLHALPARSLLSALILASIGLLLSVSGSAATAPAATQDRKPTFLRGVNIDNWLSQNEGDMTYAAPWFTAEDVAWIAGHGFDHIRFPIDSRIWLKPDGSLDESKVAPFDRALKWVRKNHLGAILDVHFLNGADFNSGPASDVRVFTDPALMDKAADLWRLLARRYAQEGDYLRFEILNEPKAEKNAQLNVFNFRMLAAIRESNPTRVVYFPVNRWNTIPNVDDLELPANDPNVAITVHFYEPLLFTHQKANWVYPQPDQMPPIPFPGAVPDLSRLPLGPAHPLPNPLPTTLSAEQDIDPLFAHLAAWAKSKAPGREILLGEFGVYFRADPQSTINWVRAVRHDCERYGFGWCVWGYRSVFPVRHKDGSPAPMLEGLTSDR